MRLVQRRSDRLAFRYIPVLKSSRYELGVLVPWWNLVGLEELHFLHNLDQIIQMSGATLLQRHACQHFDRSFKLLLVEELVIDFLSQNIARHQINSKVNLNRL